MTVWYQRADGRWLVYCRKSKEVYLWSRVVVWDALGRELATDEHVHHINGDRADDRIENLEVLSNAEHARRHGREAKRIAILDKARPGALAALTARAAAITHCKNGHPLSGANLYRQPNGKRVCLICKRERVRAWRRRARVGAEQ